MKVLLVNSFLYGRGGDTTAAFAGARALEAAGVEVIPFAMRHPENAPSAWERHFAPHRDTLGAEGPARLRAALGAIWSRGAALAARRLAERVRPDVAWIHHLHRHLSPSIIPAFAELGVRVAWTLHDYELVCATGLAWREGRSCARCAGHRWTEAVRGRCKRDSLAQSAWVALEKQLHGWSGVHRRVHQFFAPSRFLADQVEAAGFGPVAHLPNPVEDPGAAEGPGRGWLVAGRLSPEKGLDVALAAGVPGLVLVGPGASPQPGVEVRGPLPHAETLAAIRAAAVVAVPSRWPENAPYAVLEAQAAGRPVVASAVGGIPELIEDGVDGLLVPPGDPAALARALRSLLADPARAARLGAAGRARVLARNDPAAFARAWLGRFA